MKEKEHDDHARSDQSGNLDSLTHAATTEAASDECECGHGWHLHSSAGCMALRGRQRCDCRRVQGLPKLGHTPGPWAWEWVAEKSNEWAVGQAWREDGTPISGQIQEGEWLEDTIIERRLIGMNESGHAYAADARLIAAAPELLEACRAALNVIPCLKIENWPPGWRLKSAALLLLRAAIAKAEGTQVGSATDSSQAKLAGERAGAPAPK